MDITKITHPQYNLWLQEWTKWRLTYEGGRRFIQTYLKQYSARETPDDFTARKETTYCPAFAKAAINEIKNSIYQRMSDIRRIGGNPSYQNAASGVGAGVDGEGRSMDTFLGQEILPELLSMANVGIFVDMPKFDGTTIMETQDKSPYMYMYTAEDILSWDYRNNTCYSILLRDTVLSYDNDTGLPNGTYTRYRRCWLNEKGTVTVQFYDQDDSLTISVNKNNVNYVPSEQIEINLPFVPFVPLGLNDSLLKDVADYQIALLNIASTDMGYVLKANYPFYTEQFDPVSSSPYVRPSADSVTGEQKEAQSSKDQNIKIGATSGRRYPKSTERPGFIHPSSEPLIASMAKQKQLKDEIRQLVNLALTNAEPKFASAESKGMDNRSLESGLSYIGLELENAEQRIAEIWAAYTNSIPATINYPKKYSLKSDQDKREDAKGLIEFLAIIPSATYKQAISIKIAETLIGSDVTNEDWNKIIKEIKASGGLTSALLDIQTDVEVGLVSLDLASKLRGYPDGEVEKAANDHADRLARIQAAQTPPAGSGDPSSGDPAARGVKDKSPTPATGGSKEKKQAKDTTKDAKVTDKTRGEGK